MPYRIYTDRETLRIDFTGVVNLNEIEEIGRALHEIEISQAVAPHRITDLSACSGPELKFSVIMAIARHRRAQKFANHFKSAIIATQPVHVGIARMFATINDHPQIRIQIFPSLPEAQAWIAGA